ncbi:transposase [Schaalia turicensis]|uniref:transposase n=1 Tax=Schaalia turicensis TaxID=131111 RepID=UPI003683F0B6
MPKKFDQAAKDCVIRLVEERILAEGISLQDACRAVAPTYGVSWHTARRWVQQARKNRQVGRAEEDVLAENMRLRRENQELRDVNELLKAASAFFACQAGHPHQKL